MQISALNNFNSVPKNSFKGLLKVNNNTYVNTDHIVSISEDYDSGTCKKVGTSINMIDNHSHFCSKVPLETVIDAYQRASGSKTAIVDVSKGYVSIDNTKGQ